jgi:DNA-directed RNA polymerase specialized sigma24 family protein
MRIAHRMYCPTSIDDPGSVYASWERLEHSETQRLLLEFAYHGGMRTDDKHARFPLASVFFDVVWWWAWYVDSPFLRQLLSAWSSSARGEHDRTFVADLERFCRSYMAMTQSSGGHVEAGAAEAAAALQEITRSLDLGQAGATNRHVFAITSALLGDARRLLDLQDARVDQYYASALAAFRENAAEAAFPSSRTDMRSVEDDAWCVPWVLYRQADLALDRGKRAVAQTVALDALDRALAPMNETDRDLEIIAKCHRVIGDALLDKNPAAAFCEFARVVYAAYTFHATPLPDAYTRRFHREQVQLVMDRLRRLADTHPKAALPIIEELATFRLGSARTDWSELFARRCWDELQTLLFPREPWPEELDCDSPYSRRVRVVREALGPKLLEPALGARPTRHRIRRLVGRRWHDDPNLVGRSSRFVSLADPAVPDDYFNAEDDQCWPRWWLDDSAPVEWPHDIEQISELPARVEAALRAALEDLPALRRQVLELRDVQGWSRTAVSRELGISEDDQMLMLHRARSAVRRALDKQLSGVVR